MHSVNDKDVLDPLTKLKEVSSTNSGLLHFFVIEIHLG